MLQSAELEQSLQEQRTAASATAQKQRSEAARLEERIGELEKASSASEVRCRSLDEEVARRNETLKRSEDTITRLKQALDAKEEQVRAASK